MSVPNRILPIIVLAQFCCTSLWFAGNAVVNDLINDYNLESSVLGYLTSLVQFGFIIGTFLFAIFSISDRFSPSKVFFACALFGGLINLGIILENNNFYTLGFIRFVTGFALAGIYPVGMKIASDYYNKGLGKSLGFLVGALVFGTAFPHFLNAFTGTLPWKFVIITTSFIAILGGALIVLLVPDGPFRKPAQKIKFSAFIDVFKNKTFKHAAFGYFGHMWELYTFWAFVPVIIHNFNNRTDAKLNESLFSFLIIGVGGIACVAGGYLAQKHGARPIARLALFISGLCCLLSPFIDVFNSPYFLISLLIIWGISVIPDSPLFSTLVAQNAPQKNKGTAITIVNSIGFAITIISIQLMSFLVQNYNSSLVLLILAAGPIIGLISTRTKSLK